MSDMLTTQVLDGPGPDANLGYLFRLAHQRFRARLGDALADVGLSTQEYSILSLFETREELSTSELARLAQVTRQTMHTATRALEQAGLLERRAVNKRLVLMWPTRKGRALLASATAQARAIEHAAFVSVSDDDERTIRAWLSHLAVVSAADESSAK